VRRVLYPLLAALILTGCHQPPPYTSTYTMPVAIIGDSYTRGSDMGGNGDHGWPKLVTSELDRQGVPIKPVVGAVRGVGYVDRGRHGTVFDDQIPKAVAPDDWLVVLFGSRNDVGFPLPDLTAAVERTLADVKAAAPNAKVLVIGPPWTNANPPQPFLWVRDILKSQAGAVGATFVDPIADGWFADQPDLIGTDGVHPTDAGHQYMADKIAPLIAQQLQHAPGA
jgi:lysophospholipase L1-like esterase